MTVERLTCPNCGHQVEIFSDEQRVRCPNCKAPVYRELKENSCLFWCRHAEQCVGPEKFAEMLEARKRSQA